MAAPLFLNAAVLTYFTPIAAPAQRNHEKEMRIWIMD